MNIITIGGATQDTFITYENAETMHLHSNKGKLSYLLLQEGGKTEIKEILYASGGGANNSAFAFKKLGFDVSIFSKIGNDEQGKFIIKQLKKAGVEIKHLCVTDKNPTGISFIIPSLEGDRSILAYRGSNASVKKTDIPFEIIKDAERLYITSLSGNSAQLLLPIVKEAAHHNIPVATNPGTSQLVAGAPTLLQSLPYIDTLILNASEAKKFMLSLVQTNQQLKAELAKASKRVDPNIQPSLLESSTEIEDVWFNLHHFFQEVLSRGTKTVVVTNGAEGVYVAHKNIVYFHPSLKVKVINTLGSGDAFGSSFVGTLAAGKTIGQAIRQGVVNAASTVGFMDAKEGLLSMKELTKRASTLDKALLLKFKLKA